jgi:U3 small nucleolar RNA-associated protein 19
MPHFEASSVAGKKRKRTAENSSKKSSKSAKAKGIDQSDSESQTREDEILQLEYDISQSRKHYNNIAQLLGIANSLEDTKESAGIAAIALCRTFCRLFAAGSFEKSKGAPESEIMVVKWLEERYHEYVELLLGQIRDGSSVERTSAVTMVMRLVKHEVDSQGESLWTKGTFSRLLRILATQSEDSEVPIGEFLQKFFLKYDDVRYYSLALLP